VHIPIPLEIFDFPDITSTEHAYRTLCRLGFWVLFTPYCEFSIDIGHIPGIAVWASYSESSTAHAEYTDDLRQYMEHHPNDPHRYDPPRIYMLIAWHHSVAYPTVQAIKQEETPCHP
jgi:hypothetical protein